MTFKSHRCWKQSLAALLAWRHLKAFRFTECITFRELLSIINYYKFSAIAGSVISHLVVEIFILFLIVRLCKLL